MSARTRTVTIYGDSDEPMEVEGTWERDEPSVGFVGGWVDVSVGDEMPARGSDLWKRAVEALDEDDESEAPDPDTFGGSAWDYQQTIEIEWGGLDR